MRVPSSARVIQFSNRHSGRLTTHKDGPPCVPKLSRELVFQLLEVEGGTCQTRTHRAFNFDQLTAQVTIYKTPQSIKQERISPALVQLILPTGLMRCSPGRIPGRSAIL